MRIIIYLAAAIALLRSAAAFLPNPQDEHDSQDRPHIQPAEGAEKAVNIPPAPPPNADAATSAQRSGSGFEIGSLTSQWAITYTPYTSTLSCLPPSTIRSDVATIARKGFTSIRLYSIDCSALHHVGHAAQTHGLKMIVGIPLDDGPADANAQLSDIMDWAGNSSTSGWDPIELIVMGNEAIFNDQITAPALAALLASSRAALRASGYHGPLTTTEPLSILLQHRPTLCPTLDLSAANIHPFFHPSVTAATAGAYVSSELARLDAACPGLDAINLETGWPSRGSPNGAAVPGYLEQWIAVADIMRSAGGRSAFLGLGDEGWKDEGRFGVERSWGCGHVFGE